MTGKLGFTVVLTLCVLFVALFVGTPRRVTGGSGSGASTGGDANGDGAVDISDAINILRFLFQEGPPPVACADSPELLTRVSALENSLAELQASKLAFFVRGVTIKMDIPCSCERVPQCWYDGAVELLPAADHVIRKGTLEKDGIRFSTDRDADLLFDFELDGPGYGAPLLFFDGNSLNGSPLSPSAAPPNTIGKIFIPSVKAGEHVLTATGRALCNDSPTSRAQIDMLLKSLHVQYLD